MSGWIKLQREIMDHWIAQDNEYLAVWIRMLAEANFEAQTKMFNGQVLTVGRGQFIFGLESYAEKTKVSVARLRRLITLLEKHQMISRVKFSKYSLISIVNYEKHQSDGRQEAGKEQADSKQTASRTQADNNTIRNKEIKETKELKKKEICQQADKFTPPTVEDVDQYMQSICRGSFDEAEKFVNFYESKGWLVGKSGMKSWQAAVRNWTKSTKPVANQHGFTIDQARSQIVGFLND